MENLTNRQKKFQRYFNKKLAICELQSYRAKRIFLANAEEPRIHIAPYFPAERKDEIPAVALGGIITGNEKISPGIICVIPYSIKKIRRNLKLRQKILSQVLWIAKELEINYIALSGVLPQTLGKDHVLSSEFITGEKGTLFAIIECFYHLKKILNLSSPKIAVLGGNGRIGIPLISQLKLKGEDIFSVDIADSRKKISPANFIINLAPYGDILLEYTKYLQKNIYILSDTYPKMTQTVHDSIHYRVSLKAIGIKYNPPIPTFNPYGILGCDGEALTRSSLNYLSPFCTQDEFNEAIRKLGVQAAPILWGKDG